MEFKEALNSIYNREDSDAILKKPFLAYSYLLDLTGDSPNANGLSKIYLRLNKEVDVLEMIRRAGVDQSLVNLVPYYKMFKQDYDPIEFKTVVRAMVELFEPDYF